jgi:hypothetical protein
MGGHPYLVQRGLHEMATHAVGIEAMEARAADDTGIFGDHLRRLLALLSQEPELCDVIRELLPGEPCRSEASFRRLRSTGVLVGESAAAARPRCRLYTAYLGRHLM